MSRTIKPLSAAILDRLTGVLVKYAHIRPSSSEALAAVVESDRDFARMMKKFYWEEGDGLETADQDDFKDLIGLRFAGERWPGLDSDPDYFEKIFVPRLHGGAAAAGWEIV